MNLEQYNAGTNPFLALSNMLKDKDSGGRVSLNHALIMQQVHHAGVMEQLERGHEYATQEATVAHRRSLQTQRIGHQQATELENLKATHAAALNAQQHEQAIQAAHVKAGLDEAAASATHARNLELHDAITKAAQAGTEVSGKMGDASFKFTKKMPKTRAVSSAVSSPVSKPEAPAAPAKELPEAGSGGWVQPTGKFKRLNKKVNLVSKPSVVKEEAKPAKVEKSGPAVARDPKTGRAISLKKK